MKIVIKILSFILMVSFLSCEKDFVTNCQDCTAEEPVNVELTISVEDLVSSSFNFTINIYEGNLEDNLLIKSFTLQSRNVTYYEAQINKKYTVTASYSFGNRTYIAVDSTIPRIRYVTNECDQPCYYVYNKSLNLRLKYQ